MRLQRHVTIVYTSSLGMRLQRHVTIVYASSLGMRLQRHVTIVYTSSLGMRLLSPTLYRYVQVYTVVLSHCVFGHCPVAGACESCEAITAHELAVNSLRYTQ